MSCFLNPSMSGTISVLTHRLRNCQEYVARVLKSDIFVVFPGDRNWNSAWSEEVGLSGPVNGGGRERSFRALGDVLRGGWRGFRGRGFPRAALQEHACLGSKLWSKHACLGRTMRSTDFKLTAVGKI